MNEPAQFRLRETCFLTLLADFGTFFLEFACCKRHCGASPFFRDSTGFCFFADEASVGCLREFRGNFEANGLTTPCIGVNPLVETDGDHGLETNLSRNNQPETHRSDEPGIWVEPVPRFLWAAVLCAFSISLGRERGTEGLAYPSIYLRSDRATRIKESNFRLREREPRLVHPRS